MVGGQRPIGAHEGVLGRLLRLTGVTQHTQGDGVQAVLVGDHERLERGIDVVSQGSKERRVAVVHHRPEPT